MTDGASAVIPEVLAGQILSLARRGRGGPRHTILAATTDDSQARDRLVVLLQPTLEAEHDSDDAGGLDRNEEREKKDGDFGTLGADERPRHALVIPCVPDQVKIGCFR